MAAVGNRMHRWESASWADFVVPALAAAVWWALLSTPDDIEELRGIVFVGGPLVLLAGLHARVTGYLHDRARITTLPLPLETRAHWRAARPRHRLGFLVSVVLGTAAVLAAAQVGTADDPVSVSMALGGEWLWLCIMAALVEPVIPAASSWLGRRFPDDSSLHRLQNGAGGGWTRPEAVVHLYAPALALGLAALLALPGQLTMARVLTGGSVSSSLAVVSLAPLVLGLVLRVAARPAYGRGLWQAVPWLREATRTLAGPPLPERAPALVTGIRDPVQRLLVLQLIRTTPLPVLRLLALLGCCIVLAARSQPPQAPGIGILVALCGLWLVPAASVVSGRSARARLFGALPIPAAARAGGAAGLVVLIAIPPALAGAALVLRWSVLA